MIKVFFKNELDSSVRLSAGESEHDLLPNQEVEVALKDGDCLYVDNLNYLVKEELNV